MQKKILITIFAVLLLAIMVIFSFMLSVDVPVVQENYPTDDISLYKKHKKKPLPVYDKEYYYPVNDLFIRIDIKAPIKVAKKKELRSENAKKEPIAIYRLVIKKDDRYSMFCVKQTLSYFSLPYIITKEKNNKEIIVDSQNVNGLHKIANELKRYNINSTIKKVWL